MQQIPIYQVWLESWTAQDVMVFGALAAVAFGLMLNWARRRARPNDPADLGLGPSKS